MGAGFGKERTVNSLYLLVNPLRAWRPVHDTEHLEVRSLDDGIHHADRVVGRPLAPTTPGPGRDIPGARAGRPS